MWSFKTLAKYVLNFSLNIPVYFVRKMRRYLWKDYKMNKAVSLVDYALLDEVLGGVCITELLFTCFIHAFCQIIMSLWKR